MNEPLSITERRYLERSGERFLADGVTIRCHAVSKTRLRQRREDENNPDLTSDDVWPELQCIRAAEPGSYACKYHGGRSVGVKRIETLSDVLSIDMREKLRMVMQNPDYMNRYEEMALLLARNAQLFETMQAHEGGRLSWEMVDDAIVLIEKGEIHKGTSLLNQVIDNIRQEHGAWDEVRENIVLLDKLTRTQMNTAKEMRQMMTTEQVMVMIERIFDIAVRAVERYIEDNDVARQFILYLAGELRKFTDIRALGTLEAIGTDDAREVYPSV